MIEINQKVLVDHMNFGVNLGERVALIGENGVGKTTLMKVITGERKLSKGTLLMNIEEEQIGILHQDVSEQKGELVREGVEKQNPALYSLKTKLDTMLKEWEQKGDHFNQVEEYNKLLEKYIENDGYQWEEDIDRCLLKMDIGESLWKTPFQKLSGGQKTKVGLAKIMINEPTFLILDEPTNHIDFETVQWLTRWLKSFRGTVLFISHDRAFIDDVATVTIELTTDGTRTYHGGYSFYKSSKEQEIKSERTLYDKGEKEKKKIREMIQVYKNWHQKAKSAASVRDPFAQKQAGRGADKYKAKEKILERLEKNSIPKPKETATISAHFQSGDFSAKKMIQLSHVFFSTLRMNLFFKM